jgi:hypothetical protein
MRYSLAGKGFDRPSHSKEELHMRSFLTAFCCLCLIASMARAQSDRGAITGTITDPAGAMVPNAPVEAKNINTGAVYQAASSNTGNYTLAQLPAGTYQIIVAMSGFKQYVRTGLTVMVAQTLRVDVKLEVGSISDTVTVSADAPLLKTESGELSHNISTDRLDDLPILSAAGMRDPFTAVNLMPGTGGTGGSMRINGMPGFTMSLRIDGQDATQNIWTLAYGMSSPSVDSVEETAVQTSNYAAEYGQAGGGILNMTMRSGTNQPHGSAFEYFRNEALNALPPYKNGPGYEKPRDRQHDFGFNLGGPVYIPKVYDGRDKTFFFYSFEQNRLKTTNNALYTLPTAAFQGGDFSSLLGNVLTGVCYDPANPATCGVDPAGNALRDGTIYDPSSTHTVTSAINGKDYVVRNPFTGCDGNHPNQICMTSAAVDPVALRYQSYYPTLTNNNLVDNYKAVWPAKNVTTINAFKIDHSLSSKLKITGFYSLDNISIGSFTDGLEPPLTTTRLFTERTHTVRLSADYTISPTMLLHVGAGLMHFVFKDPQPDVNFNNLEKLDLPGTFATIPPYITMDDSRGGLQTTGPVAQSSTWQIKPTGTASLAWVKGNHSYKFGGEVRFESHPNTVITPSNGAFYFNAAQTSLPYLQSTALTGGNLGHPYASFLLGEINNGEIGIPNRFHLGKQSWAFYAQDSWKITSKLTLDYGLRWDYQTYLQETYGRMPNFGPDTPNPRYGNLPGGTVFKKDFAHVYPHAWGPRLGLAYQFMPKTVLRAGFGVSYGQTGALEMWNLRMGSFVRYGPDQTFGNAIGLLRNGPNSHGDPIVPVWPNPDPGQSPIVAGSDFMPWASDQAGRPPRQVQWSIGIQRELTQNLSVDVSYVGNRGVWWNSNGALTDPNRLTPSILADHNFNLNNFDDRSMLISPLSSLSAAEMAAHNLSVPFPGFSGAVNQSMRPYPHIGNIYVIWAPLGKTWYDSLQVKVTKRYSRGLDFTVAYSWQKELTIGAETFDTAFEAAMPAVNNINDFNSNKTISGLSIPHRIVIAANYLVPVWNTNKFVSMALRDWKIGAVLTYASGQPIMAPRAISSVPGHDIGTQLKLCAPMGVLNGCNGSVWNGGSPASYASRVPGEKLFLVDPNSHFDPFSKFMLNPDAWVSPPDGQYGSGSPYYNDYRYRRVPSENMSLARIFPIREGMSVSLRVELMNVFNRVRIPNPGVEFGSNNASQGQGSVNGKPAYGFGYINAIDAGGQRTGQIVMRFNF